MIEMDELVICYPLQGYGRAGTIHRGTCGTIASRYGMRSDGTIYRGAHLYHWNPETDAQQYIVGMFKHHQTPKICQRCKPERHGLPAKPLEPVVYSLPLPTTKITVDYVRNVRYGERKSDVFTNIEQARVFAAKLARERKHDGTKANTYITINTSVTNTITVEGAR